MISSEWIYAIVSVLCAALLAFSATPAVRVLAFKINAIDRAKDGRRMHKEPIPRIGGLAMFFGFFVATLVFCDITRDLVAVWAGGFVLVLLGILDDIHNLKPWMKAIVQFAVAFIPVSQGMQISFLYMFDKMVLLGNWSIPVTVIWIVAITNAVNLIDGLDGLACGVSAICSASISCVMLLKGDLVSATITIILTASCIGFIPFNKNPARIFMGDTGALFLGYTLAVVSVGGLFKVNTVISFLVPMAVFALPLFDTANAIIRRVLSGRSPFSPDRGHLHHKLVDMGFSHRESVKILYAVCSLMGLVSIVFTGTVSSDDVPMSPAFTDTLSDGMRVYKAIILLVVAVGILIVNFVMMKNPVSRLHSGLFEDEKESAYRRLQRQVEIATNIAEYGGNKSTNDDETDENSEDETDKGDNK